MLRFGAPVNAGGHSVKAVFADVQQLQVGDLVRIRGVDVSTPPMHRLLGLAVLKIDTGASGGDEEAKLDGVTLAEAERLNLPLVPKSGEEMQQVVRESLDVSPATLAKIKEIMKP